MIDINPLLLLLVFAIFLISLVLLQKWLFKPMLAFMDNREKSIKNDLENVSSNSSEVDELHEEARKIIFDAKREAASIRESAQSEAKERSEKRLEEKKKELKESYDAFMSSLEEERGMLRNSLLSQMPLFKESLKAKLSQL